MGSFSGVFTNLIDGGEGKMHINRVQDVEPILNLAHDLRTVGRVGSGEFRHAASIPMVLVEAYCNDRGMQFSEFMADTKHINSMVNDPALRAFRVWEGRV